MMTEQHPLTVTDLKQYGFCARVTYYEHCLPHIRPRTYKMDAGSSAHADERKRAARRNLSAYGLDDGERQFEVDVYSTALSLTGRVDEVVFTTDSIIPVDYKLTKRVSANHRIQLRAYALMLSEMYNQPVTKGYIYLIPKRKLATVRISPEKIVELRTILANIQHMIAHEQMPAATTVKNRCPACEFRRFCNDID